MKGWAIVAVSFLASGCAAPDPVKTDAWVLVEWRAQERAYRLDPHLEEVVVWSDGRADARFHSSGPLSRLPQFAPRERRIMLQPWQLEELAALLRGAEQRITEAPDLPLGCPGEPREPMLQRSVVLKHFPAQRRRWELWRTWVDDELDQFALSSGMRKHLEKVDLFFRELLWKD